MLWIVFTLESGQYLRKKNKDRYFTLPYYIYGMAGKYPTRLLINKVHIQRVSSSTVDSRGLQSTSWSNAYENVICRLVFNSEVENRSGRNTILQSFTAYFEGNVDIKASDRLYEPSTDKYFEIDSVQISANRLGRVLLKTANLLYRE